MGSIINYFCILFVSIDALLILEVLSTTHWVVTEDGKIQAQMDSLFQLRRPYDFLALAQQEQRAVQVEELKQQLLKHKAHIDTHEDKDTHLEERIYDTDPECLLAGKPLIEFDLTASTSVALTEYPELRVNEVLPEPSENDFDYEEPDCVSTFEMPPFSMAALDHLQSIQERYNLTGSPEPLLTLLGVKDSNSDEDDFTELESKSHEPNQVDEFDLSVFEGSESAKETESDNAYDGGGLESEDSSETAQWGDRVSRGLHTAEGAKNWLYHFLALQFWRGRGHPLEAVECARRALYLVPRPYRHIPLVGLANVLYRARQGHDAAAVLHMALDHKNTLYSAHLTLGHVYANMALYNVSVVCYNNAAIVRPQAVLPRRLRHAVLCHARFEDALQQQHVSLQRTLAELKQYQQTHEEWLALHQKLMLEQATPEMKLESRLEYEEQKIRESSDGRGQDCFQYQQDGHTFLSCNMRRDHLEQRQQGADLLLDLTTLLHSVQGKALRLSHLRHQPTHSSVQPVLELQPRHLGQGWMVGNSQSSAGSFTPFPTEAECEAAGPLPQWDSFPTVIVTPIVKRINIKKIFTDVNVSTKYPPHMPLCPRLKAPLPPILERLRSSGATIRRCGTCHPHLRMLGLDEDDIAHRIANALSQRVGLRWVLHNFAALYWWSQGNLWNSLECLRGVLGKEAALLQRPSVSSESHDYDPLDSESAYETESGIEEEEDSQHTAEDEAYTKTDRLFVDVALGNIASMLYHVGSVDDALRLAQRAVAIADYQADLQFLLGNLLICKGNLTGAMLHYERVLTLAPDHTQARNFLTALACHTQYTPTSAQHSSHSSQDNEQLSSLNSSSTAASITHSEVDEVETAATISKDCIADDEANYCDSELGSQGSILHDTLFEEKTDETTGSWDETDSVISTPGSAESPSETETELSSSDAKTLSIEDDSVPDILLKGKGRPVLSAPQDSQFCEGYKRSVSLSQFTSTWLSVSAKYIDISLYLPLGPVSVPPEPAVPVCPVVPASMLTMDHLAGVRQRSQLPHVPELGLLEALHSLVEPPESMEQVAARLTIALKQHPPASPGGWVVCTGAALYWRVEGDGERAVNCLRAALQYAPPDMRDVALISLANVLQRSGLYSNALVAANAALEISPKFVVIHFTMANIYSAMDEFEKAAAFYESTLALQSSFEPARERLRAIHCDRWWLDQS